MKKRLSTFFVFAMITMQLNCGPKHFDPPPEPERPKDVLKNRKGRCDEIDEKLYLNNPDFAKIWASCGREARGSKVDTADCIRERVDLTTRCASCFGEFAACGKSNCFMKCLIDSENCRECGRRRCGEAWARCTGSSFSDIPR